MRNPRRRSSGGGAAPALLRGHGTPDAVSEAMLVIARRRGERLFIGDDIEIVVTTLNRNTVRLGILAPDNTVVVRGEVKDSIAAANRAASKTTIDDAALLAALRQLDDAASDPAPDRAAKRWGETRSEDEGGALP